MQVKVNLNDSLKVKLNDHGRDIYQHSYDSFIKINPNITPPQPKEEDEEGYSTWQVWVFMQTFGEHLRMAPPAPFDINIIFLQAEPLTEA